jgi:hypothetical protein
MLCHLSEDADLQDVSMDGSVIRAHACAGLERHAIECMFGKLKHYRRIATRYEKKAINYMGMLSFSSVLLWLR